MIDSASEISFNVAEGAWDNEFQVLAYRDLVENIAPAIGEKQVTVRLVDQGGNEKSWLEIV